MKLNEKSNQLCENEKVQNFINIHFDNEYNQNNIPKWVNYKLFKTSTIKKMFDSLLESIQYGYEEEIEEIEAEWHEILAFLKMLIQV